MKENNNKSVSNRGLVMCSVSLGQCVGKMRTGIKMSTEDQAVPRDRPRGHDFRVAGRRVDDDISHNRVSLRRDNGGLRTTFDGSADIYVWTNCVLRSCCDYRGESKTKRICSRTLVQVQGYPKPQNKHCERYSVAGFPHFPLQVPKVPIRCHGDLGVVFEFEWAWLTTTAIPIL